MTGRWKLSIVAVGVLSLVACVDEPCVGYVDYMCACHEGDEGFSCDELRQTLAGASPAVQDQCAIDLAEQQEQDAQEEIECEF